MSNPNHPLYWPAITAQPPKERWTSFCFGPASPFRAIKRELDAQLRIRQKPDANIWGTDGARVHAGQLVSKIAREEYDWPVDFFIPADPFDIVFLMPWDDLDLVEVALSLESATGLTFCNDEVYSMAGKTLGEFVNLVARKLRTTGQTT